MKITENIQKYGTWPISATTRGLFAGGGTPTRINVIEYITIASTGNATDFGELSQARAYLTGCSGN